SQNASGSSTGDRKCFRNQKLKKINSFHKNQTRRRDLRVSGDEAPPFPFRHLTCTVTPERAPTCRTTPVNLWTCTSRGNVCVCVCSSASNRIIGAKDHASIQINIAEVDKVTGRFNGQSKTYAICGPIRRMGESDDSILRLAKNDGVVVKNF
uniref:Small ribosomal subunit protein eS21 n=1 Tax=Astatotilapia calliptera TaxID=8154 RepID=A0A3P8P6W4_ASTCA